MAQYQRQYKYYAILEVRRNATQEEIKRAYRRLVKMYHPDINPIHEAHVKLTKINQAYEVLSDPARRARYDNSPAECPVDGTDEVIQTTATEWRCRRCGCLFDPSKVSEFIPEVETATIPQRLKTAVRIFQTTQCSYCWRFYTQPFLCPHGKLMSSCSSIDRLGEDERKTLLGDEKWWWRMADMLRQANEKGVIAKCRKCGALNPNPQKPICWQCLEDSLKCPECDLHPILRYDIEQDYWKCPNAACSKKFKKFPKMPKQTTTPRPPSAGIPPTVNLRKFSERARQALALSEEEAKSSGRGYVGTEHLLLALSLQINSKAAKILTRLNVNHEEVYSASQYSRTESDSTGLSVNIKRAIELAVVEHRRLHDTHIRTEHLLLGLMQEGKGNAANILQSLGVNRENILVELSLIDATILKRIWVRMMRTAGIGGRKS